LALKQAEAELTKQQAAAINAERRRLAQLPIEERRSALPPQAQKPDYLLSLWQSDCAELRQAGVEMRLEKAEVDGKPAIVLMLLEVSFCPECQPFHGTKEQHMCIR